MAEQTEIITSVSEESNPITSVSEESNQINFVQDDEIDEDFNQKPVVVDTPAPLSNEQLAKMNELIKNKSNKELVEYISQLVLVNTSNLSDVQKAQMQHNLGKMYDGNSKRALIETITKFINQKNKYIIFDDVTKLKTVNEEQKLSREELREKLRNKIKSNSSSSKQNLTNMYEKLQEELQNTELGETIKSDGVEGELKKKKKNKKLDPKKLQSKLVNQMANLMKNNPSGFGGNNTPTSA